MELGGSRHRRFQASGDKGSCVAPVRCLSEQQDLVCYGLGTVEMELHARMEVEWADRPQVFALSGLTPDRWKLKVLGIPGAPREFSLHVEQ